jgi:glycosyltransferase involved in cell wall biosynthesis
VSTEPEHRRRATRIVVVGMSTGETCGVRDHATMLAAQLAHEDISCSLSWLNRRRSTFGGARAEIDSWARALERDLAGERPDVVLLHYSVFAHSQRGIPVFVPRMLAALRGTGIPLISFLHEFAFRQRGRADPKVAVWALSHRAALYAVMRQSAAAVTTVDERAVWLASRRWLPRRPVAVAPVFSTLPEPRQGTPVDRHGALLGVFGYNYPRATAAIVIEALALLKARGVPARLVLLGSPGPQSPVGTMWVSTARKYLIAEAVSFSGTVSPAELSEMLAGCDLLLSADRPGPTSRKTTLAGALASGTAVVATDGPESWKKLVDAGASELVQPRPDAIAAAVERLLGDEHLRRSIGARGRAFAAQSMGVRLSAAIVARLAGDALDAAAGAAGTSSRSTQTGQGSAASSDSPSCCAPSDRRDSHSARAAP